MNTCRVKSKFKNVRILLDGVLSSNILTRRLITRPKIKICCYMQFNTQEGNITTNMKVKIYFTLPKFASRTIVTW